MAQDSLDEFEREEQERISQEKEGFRKGIMTGIVVALVLIAIFGVLVLSKFGRHLI